MSGVVPAQYMGWIHSKHVRKKYCSLGFREVSRDRTYVMGDIVSEVGDVAWTCRGKHWNAERRRTSTKCKEFLESE